MSTTGKQSPLGINVLGDILQNRGLRINPLITTYIGSSKYNSDYTPGTIITDTCLYWLLYAVNDAYIRGYPNSGTRVSNSVYNSIISIGSTTIPALGNSVPSTYKIYDPSNRWTGQATTGYYVTGNINEGQSATWLPYNTSNPNKSITQWGYLRLIALQAWNEFNWNGKVNGDTGFSSMPEYKDFLNTISQIESFVRLSNIPIIGSRNGPDYLKRIYSNMNDLITGDISGISLALRDFGNECITLGKTIDLSKIAKFGLPSVLLQTIRKYKGLTQSLTLSLLASGLTNQEIDQISRGVINTSQLQEQKIYAAYLVIIGVDLESILIVLNCKTPGITSLADLLNLRKLFPNSYSTLTVPLTNGAPGPTNSKTYYPIYANGSVNSSLLSATVQAAIGNQALCGPPNVSNAPLTGTNIQDLALGFGSYLQGILPNDIAVAAGAFSYSVLQVPNITSVDFEKFAQVTASLETIKGLNVNGTDVPTNVTSANDTNFLTGLGSGPNGSYRMIDFFGAMTGLPYHSKDIYNLIKRYQTSNLAYLYQQLYLAVFWDAAAITVTVSFNITTSTYYISDATVSNAGGGYGRGGAGAPTVSIPSMPSAVLTTRIGTNPNDLSTFGKVISVSIVNNGDQSSNPGSPTVEVQAPPTGSYPSPGGNTPYLTVGWPTMDGAVSSYVAPANAEIASIQNSDSNGTKQLNLIYDITGTQLLIEQRARYTAIAPVPDTTRDVWISNYPTSQYSFVDNVYSWSSDTSPGGVVQMLEAIADYNYIGGQSLVALMRESRNQSRLRNLGVELTNNVPSALTPEQVALQIANGTLPNAVYGLPVTGVNGNLDNSVTNFTIPTNLLQLNGTGELISPTPAGFYDPNSLSFKLSTNNTDPNNQTTISGILNVANSNLNNTNLLGPEGDGTGPPGGIPKDITDPNLINTNIFQAGLVSDGLGIGDNVTGTQQIGIFLGLTSYPNGQTSTLDTGKAVPGSLAGSKAVNLLPANLNTAYTSSVLSPSVYNIGEAIDDVVRCNCECWIG